MIENVLLCFCHVVQEIRDVVSAVSCAFEDGGMTRVIVLARKKTWCFERGKSICCYKVNGRGEYYDECGMERPPLFFCREPSALLLGDYVQEKVVLIEMRMLGSVPPSVRASRHV